METGWREGRTLGVRPSDMSSGSVLASGSVVSIRFVMVVVVKLPGQPVEMLLPQMFSSLECVKAIFTWTMMKGSL